MAATEHVLSFGNSNQLLYIGSATLTRTTATAPSRGTLAVTLKQKQHKLNRWLNEKI